MLASVAIIFIPPDSQDPITPNQLAKILKRPLGLGQTQEGLAVVNSSRDQIELQIAPNKLDVRDLSGNFEQAKNKVPEVVSNIMNLLGDPVVTSFGVNFILETSINDAYAWIGSRFLNQELSKELGSTVASNVVSIRINRPPKALTLRIESSDDSRITVNYNASEQTDALPGLDKFARELEEQNNQLFAIISKVTG